MQTELLYLHDSYLATFDAVVVAVQDDLVAFNRTAFYPGGGGQPCDTGWLISGTTESTVLDATKADGIVWHRMPGHALAIGQQIEGAIDWKHRYRCMQTHTGMHVLCAVIGNVWHVPVTGGNMTPPSARMDFAFDPLPPDFAQIITEMVNAELAQGRPVRPNFVDRTEFATDDSLIRTQTNLVPDGLSAVRVIEIQGLDRQADGGTHVQSTAEVGPMTVTKVESKGKNNKRLRVQFAHELASLRCPSHP